MPGLFVKVFSGPALLGQTWGKCCTCTIGLSLNAAMHSAHGSVSKNIHTYQYSRLIFERLVKTGLPFSPKRHTLEKPLA
jgi:hypothetical protein